MKAFRQIDYQEQYIYHKCKSSKEEINWDKSFFKKSSWNNSCWDPSYNRQENNKEVYGILFAAGNDDLKRISIYLKLVSALNGNNDNHILYESWNSDKMIDYMILSNLHNGWENKLCYFFST